MRGLKAICCVKDTARKAELQNTTTDGLLFAKRFIGHPEAF
jgi:hypothetical protein